MSIDAPLIWTYPLNEVLRSGEEPDRFSFSRSRKRSMISLRRSYPSGSGCGRLWHRWVPQVGHEGPGDAAGVGRLRDGHGKTDGAVIEEQDLPGMAELSVLALVPRPQATLPLSRIGCVGGRTTTDTLTANTSRTIIPMKYCH